MDAVIITRYIHFISILIIVSCLVSQHLLIEDRLSKKMITRLWRIDGIYGASAITAVSAGLILWFSTGKPAEYYSQNWIFLLKVGLFAVVGALSLLPTLFFWKKRKGNQEEVIQVPGYIKTLIRVELALLFIIPLLASLMANGKGYFG
ncbi:MAG: DUF2214 family protein [Cytophagales bacterium]|nr:DUF2214 family protein [Cytophagales bacterium]